MQQKVWVIDNQESRGSIPSKTSPALPVEQPPGKERLQPLPLRKNPSLAFSLSLVVWGGGQFYLGEKRRGAAYLSLMVLLCLILSGYVFWGASLGRLLARHAMRPSLLLFGVTVIFLAGLVVWVVNAVTAYSQATRMRGETFLGVENGYLSLLCSLVLPGWGQFLNGQPIKGLLFLPVSVTGFFSLFVFWAVRFGWPLLAADPARRIFEVFLGAAVLSVPIFCALWICAAYDAFRSCKVLFRKKLSFRSTGYRPAEHIRVRDIFPRATAVLSLLLALSLGMQFLPKDYYKTSLEKIRLEMLSNHIEIIPELIQRIAGSLG